MADDGDDVGDDLIELNLSELGEQQQNKKSTRAILFKIEVFVNSINELIKNKTDAREVLEMLNEHIEKLAELDFDEYKQCQLKYGELLVQSMMVNKTADVQSSEMQQELKQIRKKLEEFKQQSNEELDELKQNLLVPIGFIYMQLPWKKSPNDVWPTLVWKDVSSTYPGVFFRVEGGDAAPFGQEQPANAPRLTSVEYRYVSPEDDGEYYAPILPGKVSEWVKAGGFSSAHYDTLEHMRFTQSGGEVRPHNMAMKVWLRTG